MARDILSYSVSSVGIEWTFSLAQRVCWWDWSQMSSQTVEEIMMIKYYNHTVNLNSEKAVVEPWDIYHREEKDDQVIDENEDPFAMKFKIILNQIYK